MTLIGAWPPADPEWEWSWSPRRKPAAVGGARPGGKSRPSWAADPQQPGGGTQLPRIGGFGVSKAAELVHLAPQPPQTPRLETTWQRRPARRAPPPLEVCCPGTPPQPHSAREPRCAREPLRGAAPEPPRSAREPRQWRLSPLPNTPRLLAAESTDGASSSGCQRVLLEPLACASGRQPAEAASRPAGAAAVEPLGAAPAASTGPAEAVKEQAYPRPLSLEMLLLPRDDGSDSDPDTAACVRKARTVRRSADFEAAMAAMGRCRAPQPEAGQGWGQQRQEPPCPEAAAVAVAGAERAPAVGGQPPQGASAVSTYSGREPELARAAATKEPAQAAEPPVGIQPRRRAHFTDLDAGSEPEAALAAATAPASALRADAWEAKRWAELALGGALEESSTAASTGVSPLSANGCGFLSSCLSEGTSGEAGGKSNCSGTDTDGAERHLEGHTRCAVGISTGATEGAPGKSALQDAPDARPEAVCYQPYEVVGRDAYAEPREAIPARETPCSRSATPLAPDSGAFTGRLRVSGCSLQEVELCGPLPVVSSRPSSALSVKPPALR